MSMYSLPKFNLRKKIKISHKSGKRKKTSYSIVSAIFVSIICGFFAGAVSSGFFYLQIRDYLKGAANLPQVIEYEDGGKAIRGYLPQTSQEEAIIKTVEEISPAVVSIIVSKDLPVFEEYYYNPYEGFEEFKIPGYRQKGTERKEIGGGTGFIISKDGLILTNKHVVLDEEADYTIFTNDGRKFSAKVLARDPFQDIALMEIEQEKTVNREGEVNVKSFQVVRLGDSENLKSGQTVIAIGNALGEFRNTISVGVVSGLGREITAAGGGFVETLEDVIQTDAAINKGNSGGPLLNLKGEVVGINTAIASGAQSIGFAIPINKAKRDIEQVRETGKIVYPFLGIRYIVINEEVKKEYNLSVDYGALIIEGDEGQFAVSPDSVAEKAGLKKGDIVLEFNGERITTENTLAEIIMKYNPGDKVTLKVLKNDQEMVIDIILGERSE